MNTHTHLQEGNRNMRSTSTRSNHSLNITYVPIYGWYFFTHLDVCFCSLLSCLKTMQEPAPNRRTLNILADR